MALAPGVRLDPYEVVSALGAGGMGEVDKARDTRLDRTVAIKVLPEHVAADPELKQRFEREAKTLAALARSQACEDGLCYVPPFFVTRRNLLSATDTRHGIIRLSR